LSAGAPPGLPAGFWESEREGKESGRGKRKTERRKWEGDKGKEKGERGERKWRREGEGRNFVQL